MAGAGELEDLAGEIVADAGQLGEILAAPDHGRDPLGQLGHGARGVAIGANAKDVLALDLEEVRDALQRVRDLCVGLQLTGRLRSTPARSERDPAPVYRRL